MKKCSSCILILLLAIILSLSGCTQSTSLNKSPDRNTAFISRYFGISLEYQDEGTFIYDEALQKNQEFGDYKKFRVRYFNNTTGLQFRIIGMRVDIDPKQLPENFNGSEGCGGAGTDDRENLTILEFHSPDSIGGVKASRSMVMLHESGNDTIETTYEICKNYKSGKIVKYYIFWSAPSDEFFTVRPAVKDIVGSIEFYEPLGLYHLGITPDQFSLNFLTFDRFNNSE